MGRLLDKIERISIFSLIFFSGVFVLSLIYFTFRGPCYYDYMIAKNYEKNGVSFDKLTSFLHDKKSIYLKCDGDKWWGLSSSANFYYKKIEVKTSKECSESEKEKIEEKTGWELEELDSLKMLLTDINCIDVYCNGKFSSEEHNYYELTYHKEWAFAPWIYRVFNKDVNKGEYVFNPGLIEEEWLDKRVMWGTLRWN